MENKKCIDCHYCIEKNDGMLFCNACCYDVLENEYCPNFLLKGKKEYSVILTEDEIHKVIRLISVVLEPLKNAAKKSLIPSQKREAQNTLDEVKVILNKFFISYEEGEKENVEE